MWFIRHPCDLRSQTVFARALSLSQFDACGVAFFMHNISVGPSVFPFSSEIGLPQIQQNLGIRRVLRLMSAFAVSLANGMNQVEQETVTRFGCSRKGVYFDEVRV